MGPSNIPFAGLGGFFKVLSGSVSFFTQPLDRIIAQGVTCTKEVMHFLEDHSEILSENLWMYA